MTLLDKFKSGIELEYQGLSSKILGNVVCSWVNTCTCKGEGSSFCGESFIVISSNKYETISICPVDVERNYKMKYKITKHYRRLNLEIK